MSGESRYDILFDPVRIGPVTAKNRFYQVPHCSGMGHALPRTLAAMRGMKAEGGWGVVCTEYCSIHPSSDDQPHPFASLWDDGDVEALAAMAAAVHAHGALAGVELWHGGSYVANLATRAGSVGVRSMPSRTDPVQSRRMDRRDIRHLRQWHRAAAVRARQAGFDIVYVYPAHGYLLSEFLSRSLNQRSDEYGGSLANRARLLRELLIDTREAVGDRCAVAVRMSAEGHGEQHLSCDEARELIAMLAELPDLWDFVVADYYGSEMASSRFAGEASLESRVAGMRELTGKPVVSVGRFTSPDTMLRQVRSGVLDLIGAARPSIADPFLPHKIREGKIEDIRECIGCNICYAHNFRGAAIRCTQNPTMGEEWRRGWHPERVPAGAPRVVLIVGSGPAGLEAAHVLGKRGFQVSLAEAHAELGGRVTRECRLPGLQEWARVRDHRVLQISRLPNVVSYLESRLSAQDVRDFGADHVLIATGASWRRDGTGRSHAMPLATLPPQGVLTPDDILAGAQPSGRITVFDDEHYYMGSAIAELLAQRGARVTYVTSEGRVASWSHYTGEQELIQNRLLRLGVGILANAHVSGFACAMVTTQCVFSGDCRAHEADWLVLVTSREPEDRLLRELVGEDPADERRGDGMDVRGIGDCVAPGLIAHAVYSGHAAARELGLDGGPAALRDRALA
jgi:dimethylamine/trimethylamine dehydrogenase